MKKGFTLIELLAVIVILAVLALIATPIVLNIIDDSKKNATLRSSENYIKAIEFSIAKSVMENKRLNDGEYPIMANGSICLGTLTGTNCSDTLVVEVSGETPESGTVTIKSRKIDSYEFTYASGFVIVNGEVSNSIDKGCKLVVDENNNGTPDIGDKLTCAGENFYVVPHDDATSSTISLLAEKNITLTSSPIQSNSAGQIDFDDEFWESLSGGGNEWLIEETSVFVYVNNYKDKLSSLGVNVLGAYIPRLINVEGDVSSKSWISSPPYWLESCIPDKCTGELAGWDSNGDLIAFSSGENGVRPVIIVSKNLSDTYKQ